MMLVTTMSTTAMECVAKCCYLSFSSACSAVAIVKEFYGRIGEKNRWKNDPAARVHYFSITFNTPCSSSHPVVVKN